MIRPITDLLSDYHHYVTHDHIGVVQVQGATGTRYRVDSITCVVNVKQFSLHHSALQMMRRLTGAERTSTSILADRSTNAATVALIPQSCVRPVCRL